MKHILIKTDLSSLICYRKLVYERYPNILIMTTSVELPANVISMFTCAVINIHYEKLSGTCFLLADISIYCFDSWKQSW